MTTVDEILEPVRHLCVFNRFNHTDNVYEVLIRWYYCPPSANETSKLHEVIGKGSTLEAAAESALVKYRDRISKLVEQLDAHRWDCNQKLGNI